MSFSPTGNFPQNTLFFIKDQPPTVKNTEYYIQPKSLHKEWHKTDKLHIKNIKSLQLTDICLGKFKFYLHPVFHKLLKRDQVLQPKMAANDHAWETGNFQGAFAWPIQKIPGKYSCNINVPKDGDIQLAWMEYCSIKFH